MNTDIIVAALAFLGTLSGTFGGIVAANRLTNYRISELEKQMQKHNDLVERLTIVEQSTKSAHRRLDELLREVE